MKRILIVLVIVAFLLCGCAKEETEETEKMQQRFTVEYQERHGPLESITIIRDAETGEAYLFAHSGYAGGLTILEEGE